MTLKIRFWHFLTAIFGHLTSLMKKSNPFLWSVQSYLQSEMFLSNSVDMMKNLLKDFLVLFLSSPIWKNTQTFTFHHKIVFRSGKNNKPWNRYHVVAAALLSASTLEFLISQHMRLFFFKVNFYPMKAYLILCSY